MVASDNTTNDNARTSGIYTNTNEQHSYVSIPNEAYYDAYSDSDCDIIDEIADREEELYREKQHNKYYLGSALYYPRRNCIQFDMSVSVSTLFNYDIQDIQLYLAEYSPVFHTTQRIAIHIIKLDIQPDQEYCAILKTFWLRIVQRCWKKQFAKRNTVLRLRGGISAQRHFELTGTYPQGLRNIPGLRGMLL